MSEQTTQEQIVEMDINLLRTFKDHPFKVTADYPLIQLKESIENCGILTPLLVRPLKDGSYEIISGHRRKHAAQMLGLKTVPVIIRKMGYDDAIVTMVDGQFEDDYICIDDTNDQLWLQGLQDYANETGKKHIITSSIEHKAVLETVKAMKKKGFEIDIINPNPSGYVDIQAVLGKVRDDTLLVSIMHVNNETGIIQPVQELGEELSKRNVLFHVDATQSCGKLVDELRKIKYNILSFSAHKLQGPQGVGGLILRKKRYKLPPVKQIMYGGQQEHGIRPGTIPVALVAACGKACEIAEQEYIDNHEKVKLLKKALFETLDMSGVNYHFNGDQSVCIDSTANICFSGVMSEALMISAKQYCSISNGSACTSKSYSPSYVLEAMGMSVDEIENSIRVSWGAEVSEIEFRESIEQLLEVVKSLAI